jgi:protoheme IX farnesyltransferase
MANGKVNDHTSFVDDLKSVIKSGVLLANVLPVFTGFFLALHFADAALTDYLTSFVLVTLGSTLVMAGALVLNNWYDADIDAVMKRTKKRPTVTGRFSLKSVFRFGMILTAIGFILLVFTTLEAVVYAFIGWFTYVVLYTMWSKRKYTMNTLIGSISGAVTPLIGWAVVDSAIHIVPLTLAFILFLFQVPHTFAIAMKKCEEYRAAGVAMLPVVYGFQMTKRQIVVYVAALLPLLFLLNSLGPVFVIVAEILTIGWLILALYGFFVKDDLKWAHWNFLYSVNYMTILFLLAMFAPLWSTS